MNVKLSGGVNTNSTKLSEIENNINNTTQTLSTINSNVSSINTKVNSNGSKLDQLISAGGSSSGAVKSTQYGIAGYKYPAVIHGEAKAVTTTQYFSSINASKSIFLVSGYGGGDAPVLREKGNNYMKIDIIPKKVEME